MPIKNPILVLNMGSLSPEAKQKYIQELWASPIRIACLENITFPTRIRNYFGKPAWISIVDPKKLSIRKLFIYPTYSPWLVSSTLAILRPVLFPGYSTERETKVANIRFRSETASAEEKYTLFLFFRFPARTTATSAQRRVTRTTSRACPTMGLLFS